MKALASSSIDSTLSAWEFYCDEQFDRLQMLADKDGSPEIQDLNVMALVEKDPRSDVQSTGRGLFAPLTEGVIAHHREDHKMASSILGSWLSTKEYYAPVIIKKFMASCIASKNYNLLSKVGKKFLGMVSYRQLVAEPIFLSLFYSEKYREAVLFYEKYNEVINDPDVIQKAAYSMIQIDRFKDAERILISLYEKMTGVSYQVNYESVRAKYEKKIQMIPVLEKKNARSREESMELGMAYLFSERYSDAVKIFKKIASEIK